MVKSQRSPKWQRTLVGLAGTATVVLGWLEGFAFRHAPQLGVALIAALLVAALCVRVLGSGRAAATVQVAAALGIIAQLCWFAADWYGFWVASQALAFVTGFACFTAQQVSRGRSPNGTPPAPSRHAARIAVVLAAALSSTVLINSITPVPMALALQASAGNSNSFEPQAPPQRRIVHGGHLLINDIRYGTRYPNSYLDIYISHNNAASKKPTVVVVHGGGFIAGSKSVGDPNAGGGSFALGSGPMLDAGYNVVSVGYALAPQASYPTPVLQLGEAINFLQAHGDQYGLDLSDVVLSGGSAGGHIVGQFAIIQTNPEYAQMMDIAPVMHRACLKAVVLDSAAMDTSRIGRTQAPDALNDFLFGLSARTYLGPPGGPVEREASITDHVSAAFPPAVIADGNFGTFPDQARDLATKLDSLGVPNELVLYPLDEAKLGHGFMAFPSRYTDDYNNRKIAFLDTVT